jgi:hypothetical protein
MAATIGETIGGTDEYEGLGLELLQAIIHHFIPSKSVNLPTIFTEWNNLHQKKDRLSAVFSGRDTQQLHKLLGYRKLPGYKQLQSLGTGVQVLDLGDPLLLIDSVVNV